LIGLPFHSITERRHMSRRLFILFTLITFRAFAQQTAVYLDPEKDYRNGVDLFNKQKYASAQAEFRKVLSTDVAISYNAKSNAAYFNARCAAELFNKDAEYLLVTFIEQYPASENYQSAVFDLGNYNYRLKKYKNAIEWFEKVDGSELTAEKKDEISFKMGYSYYMINDYDKASKAFYTMKDGNSKYATAAQYYYAHIAFVNENYETALQSFLKLKDSEAFAPVAPYYITQIYYRQGKYDKVLEFAPGVLDTAATKNGMEISRMVAESYYRKEDYKSALPYLLDYEKNSSNTGRQDIYAIAYSYYRTNDIPKAITYFQKVTSVEDSLTQNAYYHLGGCYLKNEDKRAARNAFQQASKLSYDPLIKEEAMFSYGKLSYELSFEEAAITSFRQFLKDFPSSTYTDKVNELLINAYANTRNYKDALSTLESIKNKSQNIKAAYQRVAYYRGVELYMDKKPEEAVQLFATSAEYPLDQSMFASSYYWSGESRYRLNEYDKAIKAYQTFLMQPAALRDRHYNIANYNIGYSYFKKEEYANANTAFRKYIADKSSTDNSRYRDALLRIADCYFIQKDQVSALTYYNQAIASSAKSSDYALYQKGVILGIQGKREEQLTTLNRLFEKYPKSIFYDDALFEAGKASMALSDFQKALTYYKKLISNYPSSSFRIKAELGEALAYYNSRQDDKAIAAYKNVVTKYPNTPESREALKQMELISVSQNKVADYIEFVKTVPNVSVSESEQDSLIYSAAELRYTQGNCEGAMNDFKTYIKNFPNGTFRVNASYYLADCQYRASNNTEALQGFEYVISQSHNQFTEKSLLNAGVINYKLKQYDRALGDFEELEKVAEVKENILKALSGQMRSAVKLGDYDKAFTSAQKVINESPADKDLVNEAHFVSGKYYMAKENLKDAKTELAIVAKRTSSEMTAESKYLLAVIENKLGNYKDSQKIIFEIQKLVPSYDYWIAKGFILLGDNYVAQKDTFQAKETYKSIVDNYKKDPADQDDIRAIAKSKLDELTAAERLKTQEIINRKTEEVQDSTDESDPK
jgi:TolA-binding protein